MENIFFGYYMDSLERKELKMFQEVSSSKEALPFKVKFLVASWVSILPIFSGYSINDITRCWKELAFSYPFMLQAMPPWTPLLLCSSKIDFDRSALGCFQ